MFLCKKEKKMDTALKMSIRGLKSNRKRKEGSERVMLSVSERNTAVMDLNRKEKNT